MKLNPMEFTIALSIIAIVVAIIVEVSQRGEEVIILQEGNCLVKRKSDGMRDIYITVCNGVITNVSNFK